MFQPKSCFHSPADPVTLRASVVRVSPHSTYQHCLSFGEISLHFWTARRKLDVCTRRDRHRSRKATITSFQTAWDVRNFSEMWRLSYCLSGQPVGPRLRPILVFRNGLSFSPLLGTKEVVVLKLRTEILFVVSQRISWQKAWYLVSRLWRDHVRKSGSILGGFLFWRTLFWPTGGVDTKGWGMGHKELKHSGFGTPFARCLRTLFALVRCHDTMAVDWVSAQACPLD